MDQQRLVAFNIEMWGNAVPNAEGNFQMPQYFYDDIYQNIRERLSEHLNINPNLIQRANINPEDFEDFQVFIKYSRIHNRFFGRMNGQDENMDTRAFCLIIEHNGKLNQDYSGFFLNVPYQEGINIFVNIFGWSDINFLDQGGEANLNVINRYIN